jgi:hypothetical protein
VTNPNQQIFHRSPQGWHNQIQRYRQYSVVLAAIWIVKEFKEVPRLRDPRTVPYREHNRLKHPHFCDVKRSSS